MWLIVVLTVLLMGYSLALVPLGIITGILVVLIGLILWSDHKTPSGFGAGPIGLGVISLIMLWLVAAVVRLAAFPPFPWQACVRACAWVCQHILFR